ncbi:sensor histidine kinase [Microbacterium sp. No. 7]|uniref:sensor histidine kinase n=1 Tax=Microbacterium sp. No. 7 TaxID=1714373 RepID=UPI0006D0B771|nr:histidine kinase [Microbacterium sp. No. 7]ALJ20263.1 hypothetical protein AOA12_10195 [Microbacterium sp. No. 7]
MSAAPQSVAGPAGTDDGLRLPRPPGVIRRFWARHPIVADVLVALVVFLTALPSTVVASNVRTVSAPLTTGVLGVVMIAACAMLVLRRRWPRAVFAAALCTSLACLLAATPFGSSPVLVACYTLAVYRSSRACWAGFGILATALLVVATAATSAGLLPFSASANTVLAHTVSALVGSLVGVNVGNRKRYLEAVIDRSRQLLVERDQQARLAADAERRRIAREMHDIVSHSLTVIVALTEGAAATDDRERARAAGAQAAATARTALREMRAMLGVLRDERGDAPLSPVDDDAVAEAIDRARQAGFPVTFTLSGVVDAPRAVRFALGRIVQEGLTNAMRHAPRATSIDVSVVSLADAIAVEIRNDGVEQTSASGGGYGLTGLRERVAHVGGTLSSGPVAPGRWRLHAHLPFSADGAAPAPDAARPVPEAP